MYQGIRLRNGAKIRELNIDPEKIKQVNELMTGPNVKLPVSPYRRRELSKDVLGISLCCKCQGVPAVELYWKLDGATRVERYCDKCIRDVMERDKEEPQNPEALAEHYGCIKVDEISPTPREEYAKGRE